MNDREPSPETLSRLVAEARREALPSIDWARMEASLDEKLRAEAANPGVTSLRRAGAPRGRVAALAAAAIVAAGAALLLRGHPPPEIGGGGVTAEEAPGALPFAVGERFEARGAPRTMEHPGRASWTLEAGGRARFESLGDVIGIELESGAIQARVVKSPRPESFVIRAGGTRVAVRGTVFRVERRVTVASVEDGPAGQRPGAHEEVRIEVTEGIVAVGPVHGRPFELLAPGSVSVSLEGERLEGEVRADTARSRRTPGPGEAMAGTPGDDVSRDARSAVGGRPPEDTPAAPGSGLPAVGPAPSTVDDVIRAVRGCLDRTTVARGDLSVTVHTRLSLQVDPAGTLGSARFQPPLAPAVHACVEAAVGRMHFDRTETGFSAERTVELAR